MSARDIPLRLRQEQVLTFIKDSTARRGFPPSYREIADAIGVNSTSTVKYHLERLAALGHLTLDPKRPRTCQIALNTEPPEPAHDLPTAACHFLTPTPTEDASGTAYVLQIMLGPRLGHALLNGAQLTVEHDTQPDPDRPATKHATIVGRVTAVTHPL
ncbi:LexA family protein [Streptomyces sp. NPDC051913]|uniref:LexA family protein n=1 Tax=Streptomyces sp. NPDC051913 TaxID=3365676 RepID=UPI0037D560E8